MEADRLPQACDLQNTEVPEVEPPPDDQAVGLAPPTQIYSPGLGLIPNTYVPCNLVTLFLVDYCARGCVTLNVASQRRSYMDFGIYNHIF